MTRRRKFSFQFRLVWRYKGQRRERKFVSERPDAVLRMLRRVGTDEPWMGVTPTQFRRCWAWLARRLGVDFAVVADISPRQALLSLRDSFPKLEYIRVESRQVAPWTEVLDPLQSLRTAGTARSDAKRELVLEVAEDMFNDPDRARLDKWRWVPNDESERFRRRMDR